MKKIAMCSILSFVMASIIGCSDQRSSQYSEHDYQLSIDITNLDIERGEYGLALDEIDKLLEKRPCAELYCMQARAYILLATEPTTRPELKYHYFDLAKESYQKSIKMKPSFEAYDGLMRTCIYLDQMVEVSKIAKQMRKDGFEPSETTLDLINH